GVGLPFVVGRTASVELVAVDGRLEGGVAPLRERIRRLNVVMTVEKDRRLARSAQPFGVDEGMTLGLDAFGREAGRAELPDDEVSGAGDVRGVLRIGRDRRDPNVILQFLEIGFLLGVDARQDVGRFTGHLETLLGRRTWRGAVYRESDSPGGGG